MSALTEALRALIDAQKRSSFTDPASADDAEALGILLANWAEWDCTVLLNVTIGALDDANWHSLAGALSDAIKVEQEGEPLDGPEAARRLLQAALDSLS